jgi:DNA-binding transcriptional ArsR family regulator
VIPWEKLARAETHPLRIKLFEAIDKASKPCSPIQLSKAFDVQLSTVSYHVKELHKAGLIEVVEEIPRRGAMEHRYAMRDGGGR